GGGGGLRPVSEAVHQRPAIAPVVAAELPGIAAHCFAGVRPRGRPDQEGRGSHFLATIVVPSGPVVSANVSISRRTAGKPSPNPPPVLKPSAIARSVFAIPGPLSRLSTCTPRPPAPSIVDRRTAPPGAYRTRFVASSLVARTMASQSAAAKPSCWARDRAARRTCSTSTWRRIDRQNGVVIGDAATCGS